MTAWDQLLQRLPKPPAPTAAAAVRDFEEQAGFALPAPVVSAWSRADGFDVPDFRVLSLAEAAEYLDAFEGMQMFPFTGPDSDPFCVACNPVLDGRVVRLRHDGGEWLPALRTFDAFVEAVVSALRRGPVDLDDPPLHYTADQPRTSEDTAAGRSLLAEVRRFCDEDSDCGPWYAPIACGLLSAPGDLAPVLAWPFDSVREFAETRLRELGTEEARAVLAAYDAKRDAFDERCAATLEAAGFPVLERRPRSTLRIGPAGVWLNMSMFYNEHASPNAMAFLIERATALTELAKKRKGRG
jgi:hypothetical protein